MTRVRLLAPAACLLLLACSSSGTPPASSAPAPGAPAAPTAARPVPSGPPAGTFKVTAVGPNGVVTGPAQVFATFDRAVTELGRMNDADAQGFLRVTPAAKGTWRFLGTQTVVFDFEGLPARSTEYVVEVPASARSFDNHAPEESKTARFETPRLRVEWTNPGANFAQAPNVPTFRIRFNQPVNAADLAQAVTFHVPQEPPTTVPAACEPAPDQKVTLEFNCRSTRPLPNSTDVKLRVAQALHGAEGPLPMAEHHEVAFRVHGDAGAARVGCEETCKPEYGAFVEFQTPVVPKENAGKVVITPEVGGLSFLQEYASNRLHFSGLKPSTSYQVLVKAGLKDQFGQALEKDVTLGFTTAQATPAAFMPRHFVTVEPGTTAMPLRAINASRAEIKLWKIDENGVLAARALGGWESQLATGKPGATSVLELAGKQDAWVDAKVDLSAMLNEGLGVVGYSVALPGVEEWRDHPLVMTGVAQVTNLGVTLKRWSGGTLAWVTTLKDGKPVEGATVQLISNGGIPLWKGTTDADGLAQSSVGRAPNNDATWALVRLGNDAALASTTFEDGLGAYDLGVTGDWSDGSNVVGLMFTDRGVYRPGETAHIKVVARSLTDGELAVSFRAAEVVVSDPNGEEFFKRNIPLSALGTGHISVPLSKGARLGGYNARLVMPDQQSLSTNFLIEEFKAPDFRVEVVPQKDRLAQGETTSLQVAASYLFGAPLGKAALKYSVSARRSSFVPPNAPEGFSFGNDIGWLEEEVRDDVRSLSSGELEADAQGRASIPLDAHLDHVTDTVSAVVEVTATEPSGQSVTGSASVTVLTADHQVGFKAPGSMAKAGDPVEVEVVALRADGSAANADVAVKLLRREYKSVQQQGLGETAELLTTFEDREVARCDVKGAGTAPRKCAVKSAEAGLFILRAESQDALGRPTAASTVLWLWGDGEAPWAERDSLAIKLVADRKQYRPGDTARVLIQNPFPGARALVTLERGGIYWKKVVTLKGNAPTVEVPIASEHIPNVFLSVVLVRGRSGGADKERPTVRAGAVQLDVDTGTRTLRLSIKPNAEAYGPREKVSMKVQLADSAGAPTAGEVALFVVDESVLALTGHQVPTAVDLFYGPRGLGVRLSDNRIHMLKARSYGEKGESEGGGGLGALLGDEVVRGRFVTTPYFNPTLEIPASGVADVTFELPDNLTQFRVMGVAVAEGHRFGNATAQFKVRKPLMVRPAVPRTLRVGDEAEVGVVVVNTMDADAAVQLALENKTPDVLEVSTTTGTLTAQKGQSVPWRVKVKALKPGRGVLRVAAKGGGGSDSVELRIPTAWARLPLADGQYGSVSEKAAAKVPLVVPADAAPGSGGVTVSLAPTILTNLVGAALQLRTYPYDCAEQTASKLLPFVEMAELRTTLDTSLQTPDALKKKANDAVQRLLAFQNSDGGFGYWSGARSSAWLTAYAALTLHRAQQAGFDVPKASLNRAGALLQRLIKSRDTHAGWDEASEPLVGDVLATLGRAAPAEMGRLFEKRATLPLEARALLLHALAQNGNAQMVRTLTEDLLGNLHQSAQGAMVQPGPKDRVWSWYGSDTRLHGMVLRALVAAAAPADMVQKLAVGLLARQQKGQYRTTQEAAWALMALRDYQKGVEGGALNLKVSARVGAQDITQGTFSAAALQPTVGTAPLGPGSHSLDVTAEGEGSVRYGATLSYIPTTMPSVAVDRGIFLQRTLRKDGAVLSDSVEAGQLVHMVVELATSMDRTHVAVDVPVPAGLELVNVRFANAETVPPVGLLELMATSPEREGEGEEGDESGGYGADPLLQGRFDHVELRDDRLLLFAGLLPRGVHRYVVGVRSVTPGRFVLAPAHAEEMYAPEVFGETAGGTFTVTGKAP